jgi:pimeloyl-ACP methyl ester carboxylesterase
VERYGHGGTPFILLHGFGTCSFLWRSVAPILANAGHTACAIDLFGHGESDRTPGADFGIAAQSEYLDAAMTALRVARGVVVGNDLGAAVAFRLAARRPDRVSRLVLVNPPDFDELPARDIVTMQRSTARFAFRVTRGVLGAAPLLQTVLEGSVATPEAMPDRLIARYLAPFAGQDGVKHLLALAASVRSEEMEDVTPNSILAPTLIVRGEADEWVSPTVAARLAQEFPNARLERIPDAGRLVPEENPERLCELLLDSVAPHRVASSVPSAQH